MRSVFFFLIVLLTLGIMTLVSLSTVPGVTSDPFGSFLEMVFRLSAGLVAFLLFSTVDYRFHKNGDVVKVYYWITVALLVVVFFFPPNVRGAHRWIRAFGLSVQPSEFAKLFILVFLARYVEENSERMKTFFHGLLKPLGLLAPVFALVLLEPNLSTTLILVLLTLLVLYTSGARLIHVLLIISLTFSLIVGAYLTGHLRGYQMERILTFVRGKLSEQTIMALESIKSGGVIGKGLTLGDVKLIVPVVESDFILAAIGEELGYVGIAIVLMAYLGLVRSLVILAERTMRDTFARVFTIGYSYLIILQVMVNLGVSSGLLPVTGVPLPFVSRGGSSLLALMAGLGMITNMVYGVEEE